MTGAPPGVDERVDLGLVEFPVVGIEAHGMNRQELVGVVVIELGALMRPECILDRKLMQSQLISEGQEFVAVRFAQVDPHNDARVGSKMLGDVRDREALRDQLTASPRARAHRSNGAMR